MAKTSVYYKKNGEPGNISVHLQKNLKKIRKKMKQQDKEAKKNQKTLLNGSPKDNPYTRETKDRIGNALTEEEKRSLQRKR